MMKYKIFVLFMFYSLLSEIMRNLSPVFSCHLFSYRFEARFSEWNKTNTVSSLGAQYQVAYINGFTALKYVPIRRSRHCGKIDSCEYTAEKQQHCRSPAPLCGVRRSLSHTPTHSAHRLPPSVIQGGHTDSQTA